MVSFRHPDATQIAARTRLFTLAESLGGVESLIEVPQAMTHQSVEGSIAAVPPDLVRLSCGVEDPATWSPTCARRSPAPDAGPRSGIRLDTLLVPRTCLSRIPRVHARRGERDPPDTDVWRTGPVDAAERPIIARPAGLPQRMLKQP